MAHVYVHRANRMDGITWPRSNGGHFKADKVWTVHRDGQPLYGHLVVLGESPAPFLTILTNREQTSSWHVGISPGDLARNRLT